MADPNTEALQKRIATLEAQVAALLQAISADRGGNVVIPSFAVMTVKSTRWLGQNGASSRVAFLMMRFLPGSTALAVSSGLAGSGCGLT